MEVHPFKRWLLRSPIVLYRFGLGGVLGRRFLLLEHTGRRSGLPRLTVLEVVGVGEGGAPIVVSGFGSRSQWCLNVSAKPEVWFTQGRTRVQATTLRVSTEESTAVLERYRIDHPRAAKVLGSAIGVSLEGDASEAASKLPMFVLEPDREV